MSKKEYLVHIKPKYNLLELDLKEIFTYKDLIFLFVKRNLKLRYAQTILGPLWLIITPLLTSVVFTLVFGDFVGASTDGVPQFLFYLSGNTLWALFSDGIVKCSSTFTQNAKIFSKVYFARLTVPISQSITGVLNFTIQFVVLCITWLYYYFIGEIPALTLSALFIPLLILQMVVLASSFGLIIASFTVKYKDLLYIIGFGMQLWMFLTPVVYPLSTVTGLRYYLLLINPVTPILHNFKVVLLGSGQFLVGAWIFSIALTIVCGVLGVILFNKTEKTFADLI